MKLRVEGGKLKTLRGQDDAELGPAPDKCQGDAVQPSNSQQAEQCLCTQREFEDTACSAWDCWADFPLPSPSCWERSILTMISGFLHEEVGHQKDRHSVN